MGGSSPHDTRDTPKSNIKRLKNGGETILYTPISPEALQRFLGFVEGRLRVRQPKWWKDAMAKAEYGFGTADAQGREVWTSAPPDFYVLRQPGIREIQVPTGTSAVPTSGGLRVTVGRETFIVPKSVVAGVKDHCLIAFPADDDRFVATLHPGLPVAYPLFCISRSSGKIIWQAQVWLGDNIGGSIGGYVPPPPTSIEVADGVVYVFGTGYWLAYVEAFSLADGKNLLRFSTSY